MHGAEGTSRSSRSWPDPAVRRRSSAAPRSPPSCRSFPWRSATRSAAPRPSPLSGKRLSGSALAAKIETTRRKGFAFSNGEKLRDSIGIAVPIRLSEERPVGSLNPGDPGEPLRAIEAQAYVALLSDEAGLLSTHPHRFDRR